MPFGKDRLEWVTRAAAVDLARYRLGRGPRRNCPVDMTRHDLRGEGYRL